MKYATALILVALTTGPALAQSGGRPYTPRMSCNAAHALVSRSGAVVLGTGPDLFDRYVAGGSYCEIDQVAVPAFVRTGDNPQCFVGYSCQHPPPNDRY